MKFSINVSIVVELISFIEKLKTIFKILAVINKKKLTGNKHVSKQRETISSTCLNVAIIFIKNF